MADDWYFANGNQQQGPVTFEALQAMARAGQIGPQTLVWMATMPQWQPAWSVPGLSAGAPMVPNVASPFAPQDLNYYSAAVNQVRYAGFWLRVVSYLLDSFILAVPFFFLRLAMPAAHITHPPGQAGVYVPFFEAGSSPAQLIQTIATWLYFAMMESSNLQATLGKLALGLRVVDMSGQRISFLRATGRYFSKILSALILCIGFMMAGFTERKQALHDYIASTLVIRQP